MPKSPRSGYPRTKPLTTPEEIADYYAGDTIECLLCGKFFKVLGTHLPRAHNMDKEEYKRMFGLPWRRGLIADDVGATRSDTYYDGGRPKQTGQSNAFLDRIRKLPRRPVQIYRGEISRRALKGQFDKWKKKDYEEILKRLASGRHLKDVCNDDDVPSNTRFQAWRDSHPAYKKKYLKIKKEVMAKLPRPRASDPVLDGEIVRMRKKGWSFGRIAKKLGIGQGVARAHYLKAVPEERRIAADNLTFKQQADLCLLGETFQKEVVRLVDDKKMSFVEVGKKLGVGRSSVQRHYHRGKQLAEK